MSSTQKQKAKVEDVTGSDHEEPAVTDDDAHDIASPSTSSQKKKKRSKVTKALNTLRGKQEIPQELVDHVLGKVKEQEGARSDEFTTDNVREVLEHLKILDVLKGKSGLGGINKKDVGEHKVHRLLVSFWIRY
jgi:glycylpeptide N-tetradecanoyltransferase